MIEQLPHIKFVRTDGGRSLAGFSGIAPGDCGVRAFAIASSRPYREVYELINDLAKVERRSKRGHRTSAREGILKPTAAVLARELGAVAWVPVMKIGSGCTMHVREVELPMGRLVLSLSHHYAAVIDRVLHDRYDSSRGGSRCVYGYWIFPETENAYDQ